MIVGLKNKSSIINRQSEGNEGSREILWSKNSKFMGQVVKAKALPAKNIRQKDAGQAAGRHGKRGLKDLRMDDLRMLGFMILGV